MGRPTCTGRMKPHGWRFDCSWDSSLTPEHPDRAPSGAPCWPPRPLQKHSVSTVMHVDAKWDQEPKIVGYIVCLHSSDVNNTIYYILMSKALSSVETLDTDVWRHWIITQCAWCKWWGNRLVSLQILCCQMLFKRTQGFRKPVQDGNLILSCRKDDFNKLSYFKGKAKLNDKWVFKLFN